MAGGRGAHLRDAIAVIEAWLRSPDPDAGHSQVRLHIHAIADDDELRHLALELFTVASVLLVKAADGNLDAMSALLDEISHGY